MPPCCRCVCIFFICELILCLSSRMFFCPERCSSTRRRKLQSEGQSASEHPRHLQRVRRLFDREAERRSGGNADWLWAAGAEWREAGGAGEMMDILDTVHVSWNVKPDAELKLAQKYIFIQLWPFTFYHLSNCQNTFNLLKSSKSTEMFRYYI